MLTGSRLFKPTVITQFNAPINQSLPVGSLDTKSSHRIADLAAEARQINRAPLNETLYENSVRLQRLHRLNERIEQGALAVLTKVNDTTVQGQTTTDSALTMAELHARQLSTNQPIAFHTQAPDSTEPYRMPTKNDTYVTGTLDSPNRPTSLYTAQQRKVESALRTQIPTLFSNSDGTEYSLTITSLPSHDIARYRVALNGVAQFRMQSSISLSRTIEAIANIIEWGSTFNARPGLKTFPAIVHIDHTPHSDGNAAASYNGRTHTMTFYKGHRYLSESNYNHEMGHGIGWQLQQESSRSRGWTERFCPSRRQPYTPQKWLRITKTANENGIDPITRYAGKSLAEDFAESLSAYMNARDNGPAALAAIRKAYPHRASFIEKEIFTDSVRE